MAIFQTSRTDAVAIRPRCLHVFIRLLGEKEKTKLCSIHAIPAFALATASCPPFMPGIVAAPKSEIPLTPTPSNHCSTSTLYSFHPIFTPPCLPNCAKLFIVIGPACLTATLLGCLSSAASSTSRNAAILKADKLGLWLSEKRLVSGCGGSNPLV